MKRLFLLVPILALVFSCNSDDDSSQQPPNADNFYALTVGNEWVYKNYRYNTSTEVYEDTGVIDSVSIVGTELIDGNTYFKFRTYTTGNEEGITFCNPNGEHFEWLRDVDGNLTRSDGSIKFTNSNYEERLISSNASLSIYETLQSDAVEVIVNAGTFVGIHSERYAKDGSGTQLPGLDTFIYVDGKGLIYDTSSFVSQDLPSIKRHLDSYSVQ